MSNLSVSCQLARPIVIVLAFSACRMRLTAGASLSMTGSSRTLDHLFRVNAWRLPTDHDARGAGVVFDGRDPLKMRRATAFGQTECLALRLPLPGELAHNVEESHA